MTDLPRVLDELDSAIAAAQPAEVPALAVALAARLAGLAARGMNGQTPPTAPDGNLLTVGEAAERLRVPADWIYRRSRRLPFTVRLGARGLRVSRRKLEAWIRSREANAS